MNIFRVYFGSYLRGNKYFQNIALKYTTHDPSTCQRAVLNKGCTYIVKVRRRADARAAKKNPSSLNLQPHQ